jgi:MtN3 and saliva related transmembrane protein
MLPIFNEFINYMNFPLFFALCAPASSMVKLIPQVYKIQKTKRVKDISEFGILFLIFSSFLWLGHSIFVNDYSIIVTEIVNISVCLIMLILYYKYR